MYLQPTINYMNRYLLLCVSKQIRTQIKYLPKVSTY